MTVRLADVDLTTLELKPGVIVLARVPDGLTYEAISAIMDSLKAKLPDDQTCLVLADGFDVTTIEAEWALYTFGCPVKGCAYKRRLADHSRRDPLTMTSGDCGAGHRNGLIFTGSEPLFSVEDLRRGP